MQFTKLQKDMMQAMKDHNKVKKDALSALVSATKKLAIDAGCRDDIPDEMTDQAILKEIKTIKEQIDTCPDSRADLKDEYKARLEVFEEYAPKMLSAEEIEKIIREKFADVIASGNKGMVMKAVMGELKGKADGKMINETVSKIMS
ncbi:MAG: GatB/YqeY domain-containing protein [Lachnospiraceae bacterium]|nr:GatB/YqeY domain-containing protein [Lachnospiraceae bacterium]